MRSKIILFAFLCLPMFSLLGQSSEDKATAKRDNYWLSVWQKDYSPLRVPYNEVREEWEPAQRAEVDVPSTKYMNSLFENRALYTDPFVEDYLTQVLHSVVGSQPIIGRPGTPHIRILKNAEPNAFALNNGAILITTGMLTLIKTEGELKGVLAHEVAHIVLDHNLENYNSAKSRESLAQFLGVVGAIAGGVVAAKYAPQGMSQEYYEAYFRNTIVGSSIIFYSLSKDILDMVGASYSRKQEGEADRIAKGYLVAMGLDPSEYGDVLFRLGERNKLRGLSRAASLTDSHPRIISRLEDLEYTTKEAYTKCDTTYDRNIAEILTHNAALEIYDNKYDEAIERLDRAIASGWAVGDAYLLKAISLRHLSADKKTNLQALELLEQAAKTDATENRLIDSEMGLINLRLGDKPKALRAFQNYLSRLSKFDQIAVQDEIIWAKKMVAKCSMSTN